MRPLICFVLLVVGCAKPAEVPHAEAQPSPGGTALPAGRPNPTPKSPVQEPRHPDGIALPSSSSAKAIEATEDRVLFLNVTSNQRVLLSPPDQLPNGATLDNERDILMYLQRRAREIRPVVSEDEEPPPMRAVVALRIDKDAPFARVHPILKACLWNDFKKVHLRANRSPDGSEGQIALTLFDTGLPEDLQVMTAGEVRPRYTVRVWSGADGGITKMVVHRENDSPLPDIEVIGPEPKQPAPKRLDPLPDLALDLGTDIEAVAKKLKELRVAYKGKPPALVLIADDKLLYTHVVRLIDTGTRAGFANVVPVPVDPKKR